MKRNDFKIRLSELKEIYDIGRKISIIDLDYSATTLRTAQLEKIIEKVLLHCKSISNLVNVSEIENYAELDIALIASAARNIMDATNLYFYIAERKISSEEIEFRYCLQHLNYVYNVKDILLKLGYSKDCFRMRLLDNINVIDEVKNNNTFKTANESEKLAILSGRKQFFHRKRVEIFDKNMESAIFNLLSNSTHSFYIGLSSNSIRNTGFFTGYIDSIMLLLISVEVGIIYTSHILKDYLILRKKIGLNLTNDEKNRIKELKSIDYLTNYLSSHKDEFTSF